MMRVSRIGSTLPPEMIAQTGPRRRRSSAGRLSTGGRYLAVRITISDRPGSLSRLLDAVAGTGANVLDVVHARTPAALAIDEVEVLLTLETRGPAHRDDVLDALGRAEYTVRVQD